MKSYYITTAIDYVNSRPHVGTAYEKVAADAMARFRKMHGPPAGEPESGVFFAMGTDEHSQNVQREAQKQGLDPKLYCDGMAAAFEETWRVLNIRYDTFIRTTEERHRRAVAALFKTIHDKGDIYKGVYRGLYCVSCEAFYQEKDLVDGKCPNHKTVPHLIEEENYFFRLTKYRDALLAHLGEHPEFVRPDARRNEIRSVLEEGLEDISVSRASASWGIPLPIDPTQVVYVWFDALINYLSAVGYPDEGYRAHWPADLHVVGKDITRFHCIIWPAMLLAAGIDLPRSIFGHGFITVNGQKLSKSLGNVIDPAAIVTRFGADALRYFLLREISWGQDGDFSWEQLERRYNAELANDLGNLLSRTLSMTERYLAGDAPPPSGASEWTLSSFADSTAGEFATLWRQDQFGQALDAAWELVRRANQLIERLAPWSLAKDPARRGELSALLYELLESLRVTALLTFPVMPAKAQEIWERLGQEGDLDSWRPERGAVRWSGATRYAGLRACPPLFPKQA